MTYVWRNYDELLDTIKTLPTVFTCADFCNAVGNIPKNTALGALHRFVKRGQLHKKKIKTNVTHWSLSPFPVEAPKKPLPRVFTTKEYGAYYNITYAYRALHTAFNRGLVVKVERNKNISGRPVFWSFNKNDDSSVIIPAVVTKKDVFANLFR